MARAPDSPDSRAPDSWLRGAWAPDSGAVGLSLGRAIQLFLAAKGAEGASPKTIEWYRMVLGRAARDLGAERPLDALAPPELRDWLLTLRATLSPVREKAGSPLSARDIAERIREGGLYEPPRSGHELRAGQVSARVGNATYRARFVRRDGRIWLADRTLP